jgi:hypothetical protein
LLPIPLPVGVGYDKEYTISELFCQVYNYQPAEYNRLLCDLPARSKHPP